MAHVIPVPKTNSVKCDQLWSIAFAPRIKGKFSDDYLAIVRRDQHVVTFYDGCQLFAYSKTFCALLSIQDHVLNYLDNTNIGAISITSLDVTHAFHSVPQELLLKHVALLDFSSA